jgi:cell division protein FtsB
MNAMKPTKDLLIVQNKKLDEDSTKLKDEISKLKEEAIKLINEGCEVE